MTHAAEGMPRLLLEPDAARLLTAAGIPYVEHALAATPDAAVRAAARIGYPVALKIVSPDIVHKTDVGGVVVGVADERGTREFFEEIMRRVYARRPEARVGGLLVCRHVSARRELIVGGIRDATFGPTVMVGLGGVFAEQVSDVAFRLAPLRRRDALDMLSELRAARLLGEVRGEQAIDAEELASVLERVGDLMVDHPEISEIDLNPVAVSPRECVALDVRIFVKD